MTGFGRAVRLAAGVLVLALVLALVLIWAGPAGAQDDLDRGKSGAQLYNSDCAICHKSPLKLNLSGAGGIFGVESFLREHYTASRESAAAVAAYLRGVQQAAAPAAAARSRPRKPAAKDERHGKPAESRSADGKSPESKPAEKKPKATASAKPKKPE